MLTSLILHVQAPKTIILPASLGRAAHALFLQLLQERDPILSEALHASNGPKPFTTSNLIMGKREAKSLHVNAGQTGWLRFTGLTKTVSNHLISLSNEPPPSVELDHHPLNVIGSTLDETEHPWAGQISYQDFAAPYLLGETPKLSTRLNLDFHSPTTFRSQGRYVPFPLPELVFGSLFNRWQAFAPIALNSEVRRFVAEMVVVSRYSLRTRGLPYKQGGRNTKKGKGGGWQIGFTGQVTFVALNRDRYWLNVLHLLSVFAFYSGVGYQTGVGLGQVK